MQRDWTPLVRAREQQHARSLQDVAVGRVAAEAATRAADAAQARLDAARAARSGLWQNLSTADAPLDVEALREASTFARVLDRDVAALAQAASAQASIAAARLAELDARRAALRAAAAAQRKVEHVQDRAALQAAHAARLRDDDAVDESAQRVWRARATLVAVGTDRPPQRR